MTRANASALIPDQICLRVVGLVEGEGCFYIGAHRRGNYHCSLIVHMRGDDYSFLERLRAETGIGRVYRVPDVTKKHPGARWEIVRKSDVLVAQDIFRRFPLWSKKQRDFETWSRAVDFWAGVVLNGQRSDWGVMAELKRELSAGRRYQQLEEAA